MLDLVVLDIKMPKMDGFGLYKGLKKKERVNRLRTSFAFPDLNVIRDMFSREYLYCMVLLHYIELITLSTIKST
jgi:CheY-like chemotaxis protein